MYSDSMPKFAEQPVTGGENGRFRPRRTQRSPARPGPVFDQVTGGEPPCNTTWPVAFTKGLLHDEFGMVADTTNPSTENQAATNARTYRTQSVLGSHATRPRENAHAEFADEQTTAQGSTILGSPMSKASVPRLGSAELTAEMAELYGLALLRDVSFAEIARESTGSGPAGMSPAELIDTLNGLENFNSIPNRIDPQALRRRNARFNICEQKLTGQTLFRGSTAGAKTGPYLSQFLLSGSRGQEATGYIAFGAQRIDQRSVALAKGVDHLGDWNSWLDAQNGANLASLQSPPTARRFLSTPRDLASYVRMDQLYQAYLNAALLLLDFKAALDPGLPTVSQTSTRDNFAPFTGLDLLAVLPMVSVAALKAVRRQKFALQRRARPETIGGMMTLVGNGQGHRLGRPEPAAQASFEALKGSGLLDAISAMNLTALCQTDNPLTGRGNPGEWLTTSYLLPMAYIEGSPMHPSYGANHATVAGACVTILKAFFDTFTAPDSWEDRTLSSFGMCQVFEAAPGGEELISLSDAPSLTLTGELDKLASNMSLGRNMAGVNYYSDYFDSLRMGERIAITLLRERMLTSRSPISLRLKSFDDDQVRLVSERGPKGELTSTVEINGDQAAFSGWWVRHVPD